jgi:hypothetical protein
MDKKLQELLDKQACIELIYRYARACDRRDEALLRSVYHADGTDNHGVFIGPASEFVPWDMHVLATMERTNHFIGNILIEIDGDIAHAETYFIAYHDISADKMKEMLDTGVVMDKEGRKADVYQMIAAGRYLDRMERRNGVWRFAYKHAVYDWNATFPSTDTWDRSEKNKDWTFGQRGIADQSYAYIKCAEELTGRG